MKTPNKGVRINLYYILNDKFTQSSDIMDHYEWVDVFYTNLYINNVRILVLFYTAMSCMLANVKLAPKKGKNVELFG
jgi:hypothetical protein